ncbi:hypothetical protein HMPREF9057_01041 [Actinomyces sp. oral taxon 171 str. F0337]|nr:hypothetical protein HMPREF9057_01041 [Actinomyces sp. oral taxon 171 str. F0337]
MRWMTALSPMSPIARRAPGRHQPPEDDPGPDPIELVLHEVVSPGLGDRTGGHSSQLHRACTAAYGHVHARACAADAASGSGVPGDTEVVTGVGPGDDSLLRARPADDRLKLCGATAAFDPGLRHGHVTTLSYLALAVLV